MHPEFDDTYPPSGRSASVAEAGRMEPSEPCLLEQALRPWDLVCTPLSARYGYQMVFLRTPSLIVYYERYDAAMRLRGTAAPNMLAFAAPLRAVPDTRYWKAPQSGPGFPCMLPSVLDVTFGQGQRHVIVLIDLSRLRSALDSEVFSALETAASTRLLPAVAHDATAFGWWLLGLLRQVRARPQILRHPEAVRSIETDLIYRLATSVCPYSRGLVRIRQPRRATGLDRALDYLRTQHPGEVGIAQLSRAAALSQRSLERAFQDRFDMTARDFLCLRRHHAVRRRLMAARKSETSVAAVAYEHGFYELGRFAGNYFKMFGERPSATLAREFPKIPRGIRPVNE